MSEREVVLKLNVKAGQDIDAPLKGLGRAAGEASESVLKLGKHLVGGLAEAEAKTSLFSKSLKQMGDIGEAAAKRVGAAMKDVGKSIEDATKLQNKFNEVLINKGQRDANMATANFQGTKDVNSKGVLSGIHGAMGGALGMLGLGGLGIYGADRAMRAMSQPTFGMNRYGEHDFWGKGVKQGLEDWSEGVPIFGVATSATNRLSKRGLEKENASQAEQALARANERGSLEAMRDSKLRHLEMMGVSADAQLRLGAAASGQAGIAGVQSAHAIGRQLAGAGGLAGISREAEQADIMRRGGHELALAQHKIESDKALGGLMAEREQAFKHETDLGNRYQTSRDTQERIKQSMGGAGSGQSDESYKEKSLKLEQQILETQRLGEQLESAKQNRLQLEVQQGQTLLQLGQQRLGILQQEHGSLTGIINSEKQRQQSAKEQMGLMLPHQKQYLLQVARKVSSGQELGLHEIEYLKGHQGIAGDYLQKIGAQRAGPEADEIARAFGMGNRQQQAEQQRFQLEQQIKVQIDMNAEAVSKQLNDQINPKLQEFSVAVMFGFKNMLDKMLNEVRRNGAAPLGK